MITTMTGFYVITTANQIKSNQIKSNQIKSNNFYPSQGIVRSFFFDYFLGADSNRATPDQ